MITLPHPIVYYRIVWEIVRHIPAGKVSTYGHIATMIPAPAGGEAADYEKLAPRWVGDAMNAVSRVDDPEIPWHRVINSKGEISLPPDSVSAALQRARLRHEGTMADDAEIVDLNQYLWGRAARGPRPPSRGLGRHPRLPRGRAPGRPLRRRARGPPRLRPHAASRAPGARRRFHRVRRILAMDRGHLRLLEASRPRASDARVELFLDHSQGWKGEDVPDPYYGGVRGFELVRRPVVEEACEGLLAAVLAGASR